MGLGVAECIYRTRMDLSVGCRPRSNAPPLGRNGRRLGLGPMGHRRILLTPSVFLLGPRNAWVQALRPKARPERPGTGGPKRTGGHAISGQWRYRSLGRLRQRAQPKGTGA